MILNAALAYARRGVPVFPVRGKLPLTEHGFKDATTDSDRIREWWASWPDANIAIPTGSATNRFVLDSDPRHGGNKSLAALEAEHGQMPATLESRTGGDGRHFVFVLPEGCVICNSAGRLGPGLDIRGEGGYIVAPPSIHLETKKPYVWVNRAKPAQAPAWLIQALSNPVTLKGNQAVSEAAIPAGQRNDTLVRIAGAMRRKGCSPEAIEVALHAENVRRCKPPLFDTEVRSIAQSVSRYAPQEKPFSPQSPSGFVLQHIGEILAEPDLPTDYLVDGLLVAGTASLTAAKPKAGKSTFGRNLSVAVAHGEPFLGMQTKQGEVVYLALEERKQDVKNDFRAMGVTENTPIYVHAAPMPQDGVLALCDLVRQRRPALVVGDPLFRMVRVKDEKAYAEMYNALGVLIDVSRETNTHIHVAHHGGKSLKVDAIDTPLGSTAIAGAVATLIVLKRNPDDTRTIRTIARIGKDIPETLLQMDATTKLLDLGAEKSVAEAETLAKQIVEFLGAAEEPKTRPEIEDAVEGRTGRKRQVLQRLVKDGKVIREGAGSKGDPFKYGILVPCSHIYTGTTEQEIEKRPDTRINTADILVPDSSSDSILVPVEKQFEEGEL